MTANVFPATLHSAVAAMRAPLRVALVNNMPDAALAATERQFRQLIERARSDIDVDLDIYFLPEMPRSDAGHAFCHARYAPIQTLVERDIDALIVTGSEPRMACLTDEPFWPSFSRLVDWARDNTVSTIWSCLAAHAAVHHLDGLERRRLPRKISGLYACETQASDPLLDGINAMFVSHSRYNDLARQALAGAGYEVLTASGAVGVDAFVKRLPSLFVFLQGHPEYEVRSLALEFRRDVARFLAGERQTWPAHPDGYFDASTERALAEFAQNALRVRDPAVLSHMPALIARADRTADWGNTAALFYRNWLSLVANRTAQDIRVQPALI